MLAGVALLAAGAVLAVASPLFSSPSKGDDPVKTGYSMAAPPSTSELAGVDLASFVIPGLTLSEKVEDDGGLVLTYVSTHGEVRAVVRLAVSRDAAEARKFLDHQLHGIARILPKATDAALGDLAFTDDGGDTIVVATIANIAYDVRAIQNTNDPTVAPGATAIAKVLRASMRPGVPSFPAPTVTLPTTISVADGGEVTISGSKGQMPKLRAENAYVAKGP
ncbi:MAG: hypothetical protein ABI175_27580, partial [Polyangiales bacterium]